MQYLLFLLSHPASSILILSRSAILQQILIPPGRKGIVVEKDPSLILSFEIRFSGWERKQPGDMYCVRTVGAASALRARRRHLERVFCALMYRYAATE